MILLKISSENLHFLGNIRHWQELKIGKDGAYYWVKGLSNEQAVSSIVQAIPFKEIYHVKEGLLFPLGGNLPISKAPSVLWSPLEKGIPISLPDFNHNYFGLSDQINVELKKTDISENTSAILCELKVLENYIVSAPTIRLKDLVWTVLNNQKALIIGEPVLPIQGRAYWKNKHSLLPAGFNFKYSLLSEVISQKLDATGENWILWHEDASHTMLSKAYFNPLTRSSFRLTKKLLPS